MRKIKFTILFFILISIGLFAQDNTLFVVDSLPISNELNRNLNNLKKADIHSYSVMTNMDSIQAYGFSDVDKIIFITTKAYHNRPNEIKKIPSVNIMEKQNDRWYLLGEKEPYSGPFINYYLSGAKLGDGTFKNGRLDGKRIMYYENKQIKFNRIYVDGIENGWDEEFYEDGILKQHGNFVKGLEDGKWEMYYPNGQLKQVSTFQNGKLIGESISYYSTGKIKAKEGILDGKAIPDPDKKKTYGYFNEGFKNAQLGNLKAAISSYSKCIETDPGFAEAYFARGTARLNNQEFDKAKEDFDQAIILEPYYLEAYANRAFCLIRKNQLKHSKKDSSGKKSDQVNIPVEELSIICHDLEMTISLDNDSQLIMGAYNEFCQK